MFKSRVLPDNDVLSAIADAMPQAPILMQASFVLSVRQVDDEVVSKLRVEPPPPNYPYLWASAKQRRAFFATNGFGRGIPTRRTHEMANGWETNFAATPTGGDVSIENPVKGSEFVFGPYQQPGHAATGWKYAPDIVVEAEIRLTELLIEDWYAVGERIALGGAR
jgi:hypothetical protein